MKKKSINRSFLFVFVLLLFLNQGFSQNFDTINIKTTQVAGSVYMLEGFGGNIGALAGPDGIILVDDQFVQLTDKIKKALALLSNKSVKFIINTHYHFDHSDGNKTFGGEGAIIVAHENVRKRLTTDQLIKTFNIEQKAYPANALPVITFDESVTFNINNETVQVFHVKNAHTDGDAIIYFKESNVMHTGDVFVRYGLPFIDMAAGGNVDGMLAAIDLLLSQVNDKTIIIPGHGQLSNKKDMQHYKDMVVTVKTRVADGIKSGKTVDQIIDSDPAKEYNTIFDKREFVRIVYETIKK
jgi:glyoxylase-like metal-dependent hydrolase (beta-lactamase superfamily II)